MDLKRKLPIGVQSFEWLVSNGYLYVDKTRYAYTLVHSGKQYFLSRPRRFGKSLFLSTLKAYWEGKRELFKGLAIDKLEKDNPDAWKSYPVFYLDFNRGGYSTEGSLEGILDVHLSEWEQQFGVNHTTDILSVRFQNVLKAACSQTGLGCVVLVDEYDKPLLETMDRPELHEHNRAVFKGFFSTLKSYDEYLRFVFLTGVTKFSKVSIFSDLNQLQDISFSNDFSGICGITEDEMKAVFIPEIKRMAESNNLGLDECLERLKRTYDGYHFAEDSKGVYNPFSLLSAFSDCKFRYYWFGTGTPSFFVKLLKRIGYDVSRFIDGSAYATPGVLSDYRVENPNPIPLLYQTGYLTITGHDDARGRYSLGFPNDEVKYGFLESLLPEYSPVAGYGDGTDVFSLDDHLEEGDVDGIRDVFTSLFAGISYSSDNAVFEHYFQTVIYIVFKLLGRFVRCETRTSTGRIDCLVETRDYVYLFEFKLDGSAEEALMQIDEKGYAFPFKADGRRLYKIGVNFSSKTRNIDGWLVKYV